MGESLISCSDVSLSYEGSRVLSELNFTVASGDYLCIVGENGSGKSTLIKALLSLKSVSKGKITLAKELLQQEIGYLPQQTIVQRDFPASVWEVALSGCLSRRGLRPFYSAKEKEIARDNLARLGVLELKNRCYRELSLGQQQRVLLARALCAAKRLLLLDEPASGLDPMAANSLYSLIKMINGGGATVIMVSHDIGEAVKYASHILHLGSKPLFFGRTEDYINSPEGRLFLRGGSNA